MFESLLNGSLGTESSTNPILDSGNELTPAEESELFLVALQDNCSSNEEFLQIVQESATEFGLYGLLGNVEEAMEATKRVVVRVTTAEVLDRVQKRTCIRLAAKDGSQLYNKYKFHRTKMIEYRLAMYQRYSAKAKPIAKKAIQNSRNKARAAGNVDIASKMDKQIKKMNDPKPAENKK